MRISPPEYCVRARAEVVMARYDSVKAETTRRWARPERTLLAISQWSFDPSGDMLSGAALVATTKRAAGHARGHRWSQQACWMSRLSTTEE